jgi:tRNA nucleotidyltransferase (CCA-adding enzyme)
MLTPKICSQMALDAQQRGWRLLLVGGWPRDQILGYDSKDIDTEVYGVSDVDTLISWLSTYGEVSAVGRRFGVLKLSVGDLDIDVSLPRRENKIGAGHVGFVTTSDPNMTPEEAAARRDFTFNGLAWDPLSQELLDPFGGMKDLKDKRLRHIGPAFVEDPTRVLRGFQFSGRFNLIADHRTVQLCQQLLPESYTIAPEMVWVEWEKWARKSIRPSRSLAFLWRTGWITLYQELESLVGLSQDPEHHPEGSVWQHTKQTCDVMTDICDREGVTGEDRVVLMLSALLHDVGKPETTAHVLGKGIRSYGHDTQGEIPVRQFLESIGAQQR